MGEEAISSSQDTLQGHLKYEDQFLFGNTYSRYKLTARPTPGADKSRCSAPSLHHLVTSATEKEGTPIITYSTWAARVLTWVWFPGHHTPNSPSPPTFSQSLRGLGFSDALSAVSNTSLIQKLGTSANELMFKKEQEKENLG